MIHEPARLSVLAVLRAVDEADFMFIQGQTGLTKGNLGSHLSKLEGAGYVRVEKRFRDRVPQTLYGLTPAGETAIAQYLAAMVGVMESLG